MAQANVPLLIEEDHELSMDYDEKPTSGKYLAWNIGSLDKTWAKLKSFILALPGRMRSQGRRTIAPSSDARADSSAALDGLRGLSCLFVLNQHFTQTYTGTIPWGWHSGPDMKYIPQFYFIRVLWAGSASVFTFFVLSGYVLSIKPLKQMRSQSPQLHKTLTSAIFRRGMRLFIPSAFMLICSGLTGQLGINWPAEWARDQGLIRDSNNIILPEETLFNMLQRIWGEIVGMVNIWVWGAGMPSLVQPLWTIGIEFRASMLLFLFQTGTSRVSSAWRAAFTMAMIMYCGINGQDHVLLFFIGMLLAELHIALESHQDQKLSLATSIDHHLWRRICSGRLQSMMDNVLDPCSRAYRIIHYLLFTLGVYLMSCPFFGAEDAPGYGWITSSTRPFWHQGGHGSSWDWTVGAALLIWTAVSLPDINWIYTNRFSRYAGKISYALYLVHGPVLHCVDYGLLPVYAALTEPLGGRETQVGFVVTWLLALAVNGPLITYAADWLYRTVDVPTVRFARWCEGRMEDGKWSA
jgi:peptidoglycan/LPS O-acetylase OafA/YrhL